MCLRTIFCLLLLISLIELVYFYPQEGTCVNGKMVSKRHGSHHLTECCKGYIQETTLDTDGLKCTPICIPACKNGTCTSPGTCACNKGYEFNFKDKHSCVPFCSDGCQHGTCVEPEVCLCDHGYLYDLMLEECRPVCTEPCINGTCVSPENCQCNPGYRKSEKNTCDPYCSVGCDHGHCIAPETCACNTGWSNLNGIGVCKPICTSCLNGQCLEPEVCVCDPDYIMIDNFCSPMPVIGTTELTTNEVDSTTDGFTTLEPVTVNRTVEKMSRVRPDFNDADTSPMWPVVGSLLLVLSVIFVPLLIFKGIKLLNYFFGKSYIVD